MLFYMADLFRQHIQAAASRECCCFEESYSTAETCAVRVAGVQAAAGD